MNQFIKEKLPAIIASIPLGMLILNKAGDCIYANSAFERLSGLEAEQSQGSGWLRHIIAKDQEKTHSLREGGTVELTFAHLSGDICLRLTPTIINKGLYCCTAENITAQRQTTDAERSAIRKDARRQQKLMQKMLDCTDAILYSVDQDGKITAFNNAASKAIRLRKGVAIQIGDHWPDLVSGNSGLEKERMSMLLNLVLSGESYKTIEDMQTGDGEMITYSVQASPIFNEDHEVIGAVLCAHNITALTRLQKEAAEKVELRTQELDRWNQFYNMLLSVLAHDLRQPLSAIIMGADLITYTQRELSVVKFKTTMNNVRDTSKKSIELLQGLLYWVKSKKENFYYKPVPLNLSELVAEANSLFVGDQEQKGISLHNEVPVDHILYAHDQMILFICRNLISNATKHAHRNSAICVRSVVADGEITISVQDNGKGMSADEIGQLFSIKEYGAGAGNVEGAGMALTIVHDMVTQMNGRIRAESEPGKGTTFYMAFPAEPLTA